MPKHPDRILLTRQISRRKFLLTAGATSVASILLKSCTGNPPQTSASTAAPKAVNVSSGISPETPKIRLGFLGITDMAPLAIAKEKGFFAKYGMSEVELIKQPGWAQTRDNLEIGSAGGGIDGSHYVNPYPETFSEGIGTKNNIKLPMYTLMRLNTHGNAITVARKYQDLALGKDSSPLMSGFERTKASGKKAQMAFAARQTNQDLWARYWLAAGGIDPDELLDTQVIPTPQIVAKLKTGDMDLFAGGEPSSKRALKDGVGYTAVLVSEMWKNHAEKVLTVRADWVDKHPKAAQAVVMALIEAQQWGDKPENKAELAQILAKREYVGVEPDLMIDRLKGNFEFGSGRKFDNPDLALKFWFGDGVSFSYPYQSLDRWFLLENIRWGYLPDTFDIDRVVKAVNREDIWREAAKALNVASAEIPQGTSRGVETFFDGIKYNPDQPSEYLKSLKIKRV